MGNIGIWQIALVLLLVLVLFGAGRLPQVASDVAKGIRSFKRELGSGEQAAAESKPQP